MRKEETGKEHITKLSSTPITPSSHWRESKLFCLLASFSISAGIVVVLSFLLHLNGYSLSVLGVSVVWILCGAGIYDKWLGPKPERKK